MAVPKVEAGESQQPPHEVLSGVHHARQIPQLPGDVNEYGIFPRKKEKLDMLFIEADSWQHTDKTAKLSYDTYFFTTIRVSTMKLNLSPNTSCHISVTSKSKHNLPL